MKLTGDSVHLWLADMADFTQPAMLKKCRSLLDDSELQRANRYVSDQHSNRLLITRGILRSLLSIYADGVTPAAWKFQFNEYGRPAIAFPDIGTPLYFNLSHSGQHLAVAISRWPMTGVDVEQYSPRRRLLNIAERYFSALEFKQLEALDAESQLQRFYRLWTLKEAYIKACGQGLVIPLREFSFSFPGENRIAVQFAPQRGDLARNWRFWLFSLDRASLALALSGPATEKPIAVQSRKLRNLDDHIILDLSPLAVKTD